MICYKQVRYTIIGRGVWKVMCLVSLQVVLLGQPVFSLKRQDNRPCDKKIETIEETFSLGRCWKVLSWSFSSGTADTATTKRRGVEGDTW